MTCGRIRKTITSGWTPLIDRELKNLAVGTIRLDSGESYTLETGEREFALVLIHGECRFWLESGLSGTLGPRRDPFQDLPYGLFASRVERITLNASSKTLIGAGCAPASGQTSPTFITPKQVGSAVRGVGNWQRTVRFVCWSDNTQGNLLIAGETITPSGNWSTIPPHRHARYIHGQEVPYEETYFFQFSKPQGFGLIWQFDDSGQLDQAFSLRNNDLAYMGEGYHPTACGPGADLYHLTFIAGPHRTSQASIHPDYAFLLQK